MNRNSKEEKKKIACDTNRFLKLTGEDQSMNQYWFSEKTIDFIVKREKVLARPALPARNVAEARA